ncbi:hypothetical protein A3H26_02990 [candidate division WWE3 bacterium RIFCSPLOWO2_12_FULL_36_10]|uniref:Small ribosomal subunit protein bS20 n=1 Tax=candidate division WWE3 bacterium RIFCSPLOWO2_12_FULL_36_10 TaxID=1802630 RepID=A0A1F4VK28_UNCKA|nr:MAG: hypothetical protein A3H26_02990 [candidate division WWE3 bacterium RIFCSPLOWO2_12_FULL_36_10]
MSNTKSAEKANRQSIKKRQYNLFWKERARNLAKSIKKALQTAPKNADILNKELTALQKTLDKAAKNKAIHKNKANRLKSKFAKMIFANAKDSKSKTNNTKPTSKKSKSS